MPLEQTPADRSRFWVALHQRLGRLANRIDGGEQGRILAAVHERIPIPTPDDQAAAANAGRECNAGVFATLRDKHASLAEAHRSIAEREAAAAKLIDALEDLHANAPIRTRADLRRLWKALGATHAELRHAERLAELAELIGEDGIKTLLLNETILLKQKAERLAVRRLLQVFSE